MYAPLPLAPSDAVPTSAAVRKKILPPTISRLPLPATTNLLAGEVVPIPTLPAMYALPVVVAPPLIVRPPVWLPLPIVLDANAVSPPLNCVRVEVALPA